MVSNSADIDVIVRHIPAINGENYKATFDKKACVLAGIWI